MDGGRTLIHVELQKNIDPDMLTGRSAKVERALAWQIMKDTRQFVPALTMSLNQRTRVFGDSIIYPGPYARYLYYGVRMVNAVTGKGPMKIPEVGYRWPRGAHLRPTSEPLHFNTSVHKDATLHWMEVSKARNMKTWEKIAAKVYTDG